MSGAVGPTRRDGAPASRARAAGPGERAAGPPEQDATVDLVEVNRVFHDHECHYYYDRRFGIVHDARSAGMARAEVEALLGRRLSVHDVVLDVGAVRGGSPPDCAGRCRPGGP